MFMLSFHGHTSVVVIERNLFKKVFLLSTGLHRDATPFVADLLLIIQQYVHKRSFDHRTLLC